MTLGRANLELIKWFNTLLSVVFQEYILFPIVHISTLVSDKRCYLDLYNNVLLLYDNVEGWWITCASFLRRVELNVSLVVDLV